METARKKEILKEIREIKKRLEIYKSVVIHSSVFWDWIKEYDTAEIAARFLRRKGYRVEIYERISKPIPSEFLYGEDRHKRYVTIKLFQKGVEKEAGA